MAGTIHCLALYITTDKRGIIVANSAPYWWGVRGAYFTILLAQYTATSAFLGRISVLQSQNTLSSRRFRNFVSKAARRPTLDRPGFETTFQKPLSQVSRLRLKNCSQYLSAGFETSFQKLLSPDLWEKPLLSLLPEDDAMLQSPSLG